MKLLYRAEIPGLIRIKRKGDWGKPGDPGFPRRGIQLRLSGGTKAPVLTSSASTVPSSMM